MLLHPNHGAVPSHRPAKPHLRRRYWSRGPLFGRSFVGHLGRGAPKPSLRSNSLVCPIKARRAQGVHINCVFIGQKAPSGAVWYTPKMWHKGPRAPNKCFLPTSGAPHDLTSIIDNNLWACVADSTQNPPRRALVAGAVLGPRRIVVCCALLLRRWAELPRLTVRHPPTG